MTWFAIAFAVYTFVFPIGVATAYVFTDVEYPWHRKNLMIASVWPAIALTFWAAAFQLLFCHVIVWLVELEPVEKWLDAGDVDAAPRKRIIDTYNWAGRNV